MADYIYTRTLTAGVWNINNPNDVDGDGVSIPLYKRIKADGVIGTYFQKIILNSTQAVITMSGTLSAPNETILDGIVTAHEAAAGVINLSNYVELTSPDGSTFVLCVDNAGVVHADPI